MLLRRSMSVGLSTIAMTVALAACSGGGSQVPVNGNERGSGATGEAGNGSGSTLDVATGGPAASGPVHGHVGQKLQRADSAGTPYAATVIKVVDPATPTAGSSGAAVPVGYHWVGVEIVVSDPQGNPAEDSAATDGMGSDGNPYGNAASRMTGYQLRSFAGCTLVAGSTGGQHATDCSGFVVPDSVTLVSVGYGIEGVDIGGPDDAAWSIP